MNPIAADQEEDNNLFSVQFKPTNFLVGLN